MINGGNTVGNMKKEFYRVNEQAFHDVFYRFTPHKLTRFIKATPHN